MRFWCSVFICILGCFVASERGTTKEASKPLARTSLVVGNAPLEVTIADDEASREEGLMKKTALGTNEGMLFVFPRAQQVAFWMKNTSLPLSIAYLTGNGRILELHDLKPYDEHSIMSSSSAIVYALEVPRGWFETHHVLPCDNVSGLPSSSSAK